MLNTCLMLAMILLGRSVIDVVIIIPLEYGVCGSEVSECVWGAWGGRAKTGTPLQ